MIHLSASRSIPLGDFSLFSVTMRSPGLSDISQGPTSWTLMTLSQPDEFLKTSPVLSGIHDSSSEKSPVALTLLLFPLPSTPDPWLSYKDWDPCPSLKQHVFSGPGVTHEGRGMCTLHSTSLPSNHVLSLFLQTT